jgi:phage terminase large subunit-like protein
MSSLWPLPIAQGERTRPEQYIPAAPDPTGEGERTWQILANMRITQGKLEGQRLGDSAPAWQERYIKTLYGARAPDGGRRFDESFVSIAKKNGKTTLSAGLCLAHVLAHPEQNGSALLLADTREQAKLAFDHMAAFIRADRWLSKEFRIADYKHEILHADTNTTIKAIASELHSTVGSAPSFYLIDELHLLGARPRGAELVRQLSSGAAVRRQPMGIAISTAALGAPSGIFSAMVNRARRVIAGEAPEDRLLPVLFELPPGANPDDSSLWWHSNPSMGYTITREWLEREHAIALNDGDPTSYIHFCGQHLNMQSENALGIDRWLQLSTWDACADRSITLETLKQRCESLWLSVDAGGLDDPTALGVLGRTADGQLLFWSHQWLHREGFEKRKNAVPLEEFVAAGDLTIFDNPGGDLLGVERLIESLKDRTAAVAVDPYGLAEMTKRLEAAGFKVLGIGQGWKLTPSHFRSRARCARRYAQTIRRPDAAIQC